MVLPGTDEIKPENAPKPTENSSVVSPAQAFELPNFWINQPALWYVKAESRFRIANITDETTKFHYVVCSLDHKVASQVEDVVVNPPKDNPYSYLREKLIERLAALEEKRVSKIVGGEVLGNRKPSQFLCHLRSLVGSISVKDEFVRELWLRKLPPRTQAVLETVLKELSLDKLAELADKMAEVFFTATTASPLAIMSTEQSFIFEHEFLSDMEVLTKKVSKLTVAQNNQAKLSNDRNKTRRRQKKEFPPSSLCYYHEKYREKAYKCISPCSFSKKTKATKISDDSD